MVDIRTEYAGLTLRNPLIVGSSGLTSTPDKIKEYEKSGAGAVVLKSLFEEQIEMQSGSLWKESDSSEAADYIHEYVKADQISRYLELIKKTKAICSIPVIASLNCYKMDVWIDFAHQVELAGADAIELNIYFMDTDLIYDHEANSAVYINILRKVKETVSIPVIVKTGKSFANIPAMIRLLKINGADGIVLFNRFYQPDININTMQIVSGNVFSNHSDLSDTLRWTAIVSGKIQDISIAASTGIHDWEDVVKCLLAGASAVEIVSAIYMHGPEIISQILTCMEEWMNQTQYYSLSQFKGKLNYAQIESPNMYERAQFMKYFSNRD
ncbi:MAG: dihydroorotate dehydrogenase-like protein [Tannerellaceae bacterium]|jgi:dihydroorotate dehydrogenase (fumarate)|nr:dihydroorotate dehydrogenase-like protein [Tannerellaceae bacterium]